MTTVNGRWLARPAEPTILLSKPVIAAVSGYAVAGGLELALWCDLQIVEKSAVFGVFCRRFGVPLVDGGTIRLPRLIGLSRALDLILTGRPVAAEEAFSIGLASRIVAEALEDTARRFFPRSYRAALRQGSLRGTHRACVRPFTSTGLGLFEVIPTAQGGHLIIASGHNTGGFAQAPAVAEAVRATLEGREHPMRELYDPERGKA